MRKKGLPSPITSGRMQSHLSGAPLRSNLERGSHQLLPSASASVLFHNADANQLSPRPPEKPDTAPRGEQSKTDMPAVELGDQHAGPRDFQPMPQNFPVVAQIVKELLAHVENPLDIRVLALTNLYRDAHGS